MYAIIAIGLGFHFPIKDILIQQNYVLASLTHSPLEDTAVILNQ